MTDALYGPRQSNIPSLTAAFLASLATGGNTYAFGIYGAELKHSLGISQSQLDTISTAFFFAGLLSGIPGMCVDIWGPKRSFIFSGIFSSFFLMLYWLVAKKIVELPELLLVPVLSILAIMSFTSNSLAIGALFKTIVVTAGPGNTGTAVGAAKGFLGLGSGLYACLFSYWKQPNQSNIDFLLMAAVLAIVCFTLPAYILMPADTPAPVYVDETKPLHFRTIYLTLVTMIVMVVGHVVWDLYAATQGLLIRHYGPNYSKLAFLLLVWWVPMLSLLILPRREVAVARTRDTSPDGSFDDESLQLMEDTPRFSENTPLILSTEFQDVCIFESKEDYTLTEMLRTPTAVLMLWVTAILVGAGTVITNNVGQMAEALDFDKAMAPASLALFSVAQSLARVVTGSVSERALDWNTPYWKGLARPAFLVVAASGTVCAHLLLSVARHEVTFVLGIATEGIAYGMVWTLMVLVIGEVFGTKNVGANYLFMDGFSLAIGTFFLSKVLAQDVYESHIGRSTSSESDSFLDFDPHTCYGKGCFEATHMTVAVLSFTCVFASLGVYHASRTAYRKLAHRRQTRVENWK